jgi:hypothetical protein
MLMKTQDINVQAHAMGMQVGLFPEIVDRLTEDGRDNLEAYISNSADSTLASFRYDAIRWIAWAETNDVDPLAPRARNVRDYAKDVEPGLSPSSVKRMVSNVGVLTGKIAGNINHTSSILVAAEMKRQRKKKGAGHRQALAIRQKGDVMDIDAAALPFSIERMIAALEPDKSLWAARAKLLLSLGGDTGRRGGEFRLARMCDLTPLRDGSGGGVYIIPRSKTDQEGLGTVKFASKRTIEFFDEYRRLLKAAGGDIRPNTLLFVQIDRWGAARCSRAEAGSPLTTGGLIKILRAIVHKALTLLSDGSEEAAAEIKEIARAVSGHSFRVGLPMDLVTAGESIVAICVEGGWATPAMPVYYTRFISARTGAAARLAARLGYG